MTFKETFNLLLEKDLRPVLIKKGLPKELADMCHEISAKYSGFVANCLFFQNVEYIYNPKDFLEDKLHLNAITAKIRQFIGKLFINPDKPILPKKPNELSFEEAFDLEDQLDLINDFYQNPLVRPEDKANLRTTTWADALAKAQEFHEEQKRNQSGEAGIIQAGQTVVMTFPDGSYWLNLNTSYDKDEADAMGHCGNATVGLLYSYRDKLGYRMLTAAVDRPNEYIDQIYAKANTTPPKKYHPAILALVGKLGIKRIAVKHYSNPSFNVEEDVSDTDCDRFREEYGYYPTVNGVTDKEIEEFDNFIETDKSLKHIDVMTLSDDSESLNIRPLLYIKFDAFPNNKIYKYYKDRPHRELATMFDDCESVQLDPDYIIVDYDTVYYDKSKRIGEGSYREQSPVEWAESVINNLQHRDEKVGIEICEFFIDCADKGLLVTRIGDLRKYVEEDSEVFVWDDEDINIYCRIPLPSLSQDKMDEYKKHIDYLNDLNVMDNYFLRNNHEYVDDEFDFMKNDGESPKEIKNIFKLAFHYGTYVLLESVPVISNEADYSDIILAMVKFFEKHWTEINTYILTLLKEGTEAQYNTLIDRAKKYADIKYPAKYFNK